MKKAAAAPFYYYFSRSPVLRLVSSSSSSSPSSSVLLLLFLLLGCSILLFFPLGVSCGSKLKPPPKSTQQDAFTKVKEWLNRAQESSVAEYDPYGSLSHETDAASAAYPARHAAAAAAPAAAAAAGQANATDDAKHHRNGRMHREPHARKIRECVGGVVHKEPLDMFFASTSDRGAHPGGRQTHQPSLPELEATSGVDQTRSRPPAGVPVAAVPSRAATRHPYLVAQHDILVMPTDSMLHGQRRDYRIVSDASSLSEESTQSSSAGHRRQQQQQKGAHDWNQQQSTKKYRGPCSSTCSSEAGKCCEDHSTPNVRSIHPKSDPRVIQLPPVGPYTETLQRPTAKKKKTGDGHANAPENLRKGDEKGKRDIYAKEEVTDYSRSVVDKTLRDALKRREVAAKGPINKDEIEENSSKKAKERTGGGGGDLLARYNLQQELLMSPSLRKHLPHAPSREAADVAASTSDDEDITAAVTSGKKRSSWGLRQLFDCLPTTKADRLDFAPQQADEDENRKAAPQDQAAAVARTEAAVREGGAAAEGRAKAGGAASGQDVQRRLPEASPLEQLMWPRQQVLTLEAELGTSAARRRIMKRRREAAAAAASPRREGGDTVKGRTPTARKGPMAKLRENVWLQKENRDLLPGKDKRQSDISSREVLLMQDMNPVPQRIRGGGNGGRGGAMSPVMVVHNKNHNMYGREGERGHPRPPGILIQEALSRYYQRMQSSAVQRQQPGPQERSLRHNELPHGRKEQQNKGDIGEQGEGRYTAQSPERRVAYHASHQPSRMPFMSAGPSSSDGESSNSSSNSSKSKDSFSTADSRPRYTLHEGHRDDSSGGAGHEGMQAKKGQDTYYHKRIEKHRHHYVKPKKDREHKAAGEGELLTVRDKQRKYGEQNEKDQMKGKRKKMYWARRYHRVRYEPPALGGGVHALGEEYLLHPLTRIAPPVIPPPLTRRRDYQQGDGGGDGAVKVGVPGGESKGMLDTPGIRRAVAFPHPPQVRDHLPLARPYEQMRGNNLAAPPVSRNPGAAAAAQLKVSPLYRIPLANDPASGAIRKKQHAGNVAGNKQAAEGAAARFSKDSAAAAAGTDNSSSSGHHALDGKFLVSTAKERLEKELGVRKGLEKPDAVNAAWQALKAMAGATGDHTRMLYLRLRHKLPWSWSRFLRELPTVDDSVIYEFRAIRQHLKRYRSQVLIVSSPSPALKHLIGTIQPDATLQHGVVVKARVIDRDRPAKGASEINGLLNIVPQSAFMLSAYGAWVSSPDTRSAGSLIEAKREKIGNKRETGAKSDPSPKGEGPHLLRRKRWRRRKHEAGQTILYVVTPRARGDLDDYMRKGTHPINVQLTAAQMLYAVNLLHSAGFIHRDIKLMNYFVSFEGHVQLADLEGLWPSGIPVPTREFLLYTRGYLAPEVDINQKLANQTTKSDIYALGICFKELLDMRPKTESAALLKDLYKSMTAMNPEQRPTASEAMRHPYFKDIDFSTLEKRNYPVPLPGPFLTGPGFYS